jgi:hypothetical protein
MKLEKKNAKLTQQICVRFTEEDYKEIERVSIEKMRRPGELIRIATLEYLKLLKQTENL